MKDREKFGAEETKAGLPGTELEKGECGEGGRQPPWLRPHPSVPRNGAQGWPGGCQVCRMSAPTLSQPPRVVSVLLFTPCAFRGGKK